MKVLVTGSHGFVGRHFVCRLVDDGHDVYGVDNLSAGIRRAQWTTMPKRGVYSFRSEIADFRNWHRHNTADFYDLIIHCAAIVGGRLKIEGDPLAVATDLALDSDFFQWISRTDRKQKIVYFSSSAVYPVELQGKNTRCALAESLVDLNTSRFSMPDQTYGWSKLSGEYLAQQAVKKYNKDVVIYRPFSGYGEDQAFDYPFPSIIRRVASKEDPITVWGSGNQVRDFIHIDDVVEGVLGTMDRMAPGETLNLGSGKPTTFIELVDLACRAFGHNAFLQFDTTKPEGVHYRLADTYRMEQYFKPRISLAEGIKRSLDFHRERV